MSKFRCSPSRSTDRGQASVLMAVVLLAAAALTILVALVGQAVADRARARTAADAIALAAAVDVGAAQELAAHYDREGVQSSVVAPGHAHAARGPSQAEAWADLSAGEVSVSPALVAIVARAEQLWGRPVEVVEWRQTEVAVTEVSAVGLRLVAADLDLCERSTALPIAGSVVFARCSSAG